MPTPEEIEAARRRVRGEMGVVDATEVGAAPAETSREAADPATPARRPGRSATLGGPPTRRPAISDDRIAASRARVQTGSQGLSDLEAVEQEFPGVLDRPEGEASLRAAISLMGNTPEERERAFETLFPEGELIQLPEMGVELFRRGPNAKIRMLDDPRNQTTGTVLRDLSDFAGDMPAIAMELASRRLPGLKALKGPIQSIVRDAIGATIGEGLRQAGQTAAGTQTERPPQQMATALRRTGESAVGGTAGGIVGALFRGAGRAISRGGAFTAAREGAGEALEAGERLGLGEQLDAAGRVIAEDRNLLPSAISDVPLFRLVGRRAQATLPKINRYLREQQRRLTERMQSLPGPQRLRLSERLAKEVEDSRQHILSLTRDVLDAESIDPVRSIGLLKEHFDAWWVRSLDDIDALYASARQIHDPKFDVDEARRTAQRLLDRGLTRGFSREGLPTQIDPKNLSPAVQTQLEKIASLNSDVAHTTETLREFRSALSELTVPGIGERSGMDQRVARQMLEAVDGVLRNPDGTSKEFRRAWQLANDTAASRFKTREQAALVALAKVEPPSELAERLFTRLTRPGASQDLIQVRAALSNAEMKPIRDAFQAKLVNEAPLEAEKLLSQYDDRTLRILIPEKKSRDALTRMSRELRKLAQVGTAETAEREAAAGAFARRTLTGANVPTRAIDTQFQMMMRQPGGRESALGQSLRSAITHAVVSGSRRRGGGQLFGGEEVISGDVLSRQIQGLKDRGLWKFLTDGDKRVLQDADMVQKFINVGTDPGTSMQSADVAGDIATIRDIPSSLQSIASAVTWGRLITNPRTRGMIVGLEKPPKVFVRTGEAIELSGNADAWATLGSVAGVISMDATERRTRERRASERENAQQPAGVR